MQTTELDLTGLTADIVSAYVAHNALTGDKLPDLIGSVYGALSRASLQGAESPKVELKPPRSDQEIGDGRVHHLPRRRSKVQIPQAALAERVQHVSRRIPGKVAATTRLSNGRP